MNKAPQFPAILRFARASSTITRVTLLLLTLLFAGFAVAQQTSSPKPGDDDAPTVSSKVKAVNVLATVRDKHGKIIPNLAVSDFTLEEDGKPVTIRYFAKDTDLPLKLGLLVDTSLSQRDSLDQERKASKVFLDHVLRDTDSAFVIHFDREIELLQDLTSSREKLESALESLQIVSLYNPNSEPDPSGDSPRRGYGAHRAGTTLYDSIFLASDEVLKTQPGRKAVIVLSDGVDRGSKESLESTIEAAQRSDVLVYSIFFKGEEPFHDRRGGFGFPGGGGPMGGGGRRGGGPGRYPEEPRVDGKKILERISKETGGRMFEATKKDSIDQIYSTIQEELRNQYNLGFTPAKSDSAGYHKLVLKTDQKDASVQARDGFYLGRE